MVLVHRLPTHLHGADAQAPVDHELAEGSRALVAVAAVHHEQPAEVLELGDGEVGSQRGLLSLLKADETNRAPSEAQGSEQAPLF